MGNFSMNKVLGSIKKRPTFGSGASGAARGPQATPEIPENGTPEEIAMRCVKQFCYSVGSKTGDDVTFLPAIVESAVASPSAAEECARLIRKFMSRDYWSKAACQYNAIMLARILADNPGPGFTRHFDKKFVDTAKDLLRNGRDASVRQILMETLDAFENTKPDDANLLPLVEMWRKEKEKAYRAFGGAPVMPVQMVNTNYWVQQSQHQYHQQQQQHHRHSRSSRSKRLPDPVELANRLEEARTSAKLLEQVVACTPSSEVLGNDLIKEFVDRCTNAAKSIQGYMAAEDPAPDNDTLESLIDANEQLQQALNHHRRAVLQARKQLYPTGTDDHRSSTTSSMTTRQLPQQRHLSQDTTSPHAVSASSLSRDRELPPLPGNGKGKANLDAYEANPLSVAGTSRSATGTPSAAHHRRGEDNDDDDDDDDDGQDPFLDPPQRSNSPRLGYEPFHPGFGGGGGGSTARRKTEEEGGAGAGAGGGGGAGGGHREQPVTPVSENGSDEEDVYSAPPRRAGREEGAGVGREVHRY